MGEEGIKNGTLEVEKEKIRAESSKRWSPLPDQERVIKKKNWKTPNREIKNSALAFSFYCHVRTQSPSPNHWFLSQLSSMLEVVSLQAGERPNL